MNEFPIIEVLLDAEDRTEEAMGTKEKFWFDHSELGTCLFKRSRDNTGEDWAEKIAAELCEALGLPHAKQELAIYQGVKGTISPKMLLTGQDLIHGNDVLAGVVSSYPRMKMYNVSQHTLGTVLQAIISLEVQLPLDWKPPPLIDRAVDTFVGYLLLDAWIGNGDRHHENWGLISSSERTIHLAPTYDHASSLGRELSDEKRLERIQNKSIGAYLKKNYSAFYAQASDRKSLTTLAAFQSAAEIHPQAAKAWRIQLSAISSDWIEQLLCRVPENRMSSPAKEFAAQVLAFNKDRLLALSKESL
jgi:HipA-like C-terminal domain